MLEDLRNEIDDIDSELVKLIAKRITIVKKIGEFKKSNNLPVVDNSRFKKVLQKVSNIAEDQCISSDLIKDIYKIMHTYMCEIEEKVKK